MLTKKLDRNISETKFQPHSSLCPFQNKLRQLDDKQQELIRDNLELKELCLYLDEERTNSRANVLCTSCGSNVGCSVPLRDDGDGSSSSTNADEPMTNMNRYTNGLSVSMAIILLTTEIFN